MTPSTPISADHLAGIEPVVDFLSDPAAYPERPGFVRVTETHMSFVFIAGDWVYKIKKPVRLGMIDFTTLAARRRNCERELTLNRRLAPGVYREVMPIVRRPDGDLALAGEGEVIEWAVVMRRLDDDRLLDHMLAQGTVHPADIARLGKVLADFYAGAPRINMAPEQLIAKWRGGVDMVERSLTDPAFGLPSTSVSPPIQSLRDVLDHDPGLLTERAARGRIVEGHGDLRPEHVFLGSQTLLIDCLEFDEQLRWLDPFDEASLLGMECGRLGADWIGPQLVECLSQRLQDQPPPRLLRFYRCYRASLRASLSIEHLRDPRPRTPEKWPRQAREYLAIALAAMP
ncbi:hypothetical protein OLX02_08940 [Novosphingobium sp. KCTC 2891]|uniref:hypothetical protein n=1 Tax=Novosphingobium sp. KCTC 2891 TaxID=2989730 RepID=UPI0022220040|nr:hypothetical protein [Novosphingobium sp. KCTC 2891]MCW1382949.1 hypothetical protein [Novosphingobium sp. KCTC 2891]